MTKSDLITLLASKENLTEVTPPGRESHFDGFKDALVKNDRIEIRIRPLMGVCPFLKESKTGKWSR